MRTALYRFWSKDELLYVGISLNVFARITQHKRDKVWFAEITNITVEHFDTREKALDAEAKAIKTEDPKYNLAMSNGVVVSLDREEEIARLEREVENPTMSDEFNQKYAELKEKIMHLALEKISNSDIERKYSFLTEYGESLNNPDDVLKLAAELANMDYAIHQAKVIAESNLREYVEDIFYGERTLTE
tara:strand:- start:280 stop:846 length:567 start_codon:yes stop_codon:yes gene_type:complete